MGITMQALEHAKALGLLPPKANVLDIGSSNLYSASEEALHRFIGGYVTDADLAGLDAFIARIARGSAYSSSGGTNEAFVGELLEKVGFEYLALDIADGYRTRIFDLNTEALSPDLRGRFDVVMNFGTTEHVLNQANAFSVIHEATKPGGFMVHNLPSDGYVDHGYFRYTPQFFFDLARSNAYRLVSFEFEGPQQEKSIYSLLEPHTAHFEVLADTIAGAPAQLASYTPTNIGIMAVLQKTVAAPFVSPLETRTSVGDVDPVTAALYGAARAAVLPTRDLYRMGGALLVTALLRTPSALARAALRVLPARRSNAG